jgi:hypothetical protein
LVWEEGGGKRREVDGGKRREKDGSRNVSTYIIPTRRGWGANDRNTFSYWYGEEGGGEKWREEGGGEK